MLPPMDSDEPQLTDADLAAIQGRLDAVAPGPWRAMVEGRDISSGSNFIQVGGDNEVNIEVVPEEHIADPAVRQVWMEANYDFVAHARQDIPRLLAEVRRLRAGSSPPVRRAGRDGGGSSEGR
jgi:hypothetical protein